MRRALSRSSYCSIHKAAHTIRIRSGLVELAPDKITSVTTYNSQVPAPLPRFKERQDGAEKPQPLDEQRRASSKMGPGLIKDGAMLCGYQERKVDLANGIADILFFHCSMMLCHDDALSR